MRALWLAEDHVIFRYNYLARDDYSRSAKFKNGCLALCQRYRERDQHDKENKISKSAKDPIKFGVTLFKREMLRFC